MFCVGGGATLGLLAPAGTLGAGLVPPPVQTLNAKTTMATTKATAPSNAQTERLRPSLDRAFSWAS
ncbi:exported hypothetical protein [Rhizobium mesoamericanum STM3625]|uniref:Uncharacterized protein n=1 Tax=Rhizobium mesoamericanum STM3625 TaxID=1211777 RepID=K0PX12_9HYPH|nr:exported hypothetical protein [Rhizobium mesoamericanum STM3625]